MKRLVTLSLLLILLLPLSAQTQTKPNSRFGVAIDGGWSHLFLGTDLNPLSNLATPSSGWFAGGELIYELEYRHLLFRLGVGTDYSRTALLFSPPDQSRQVVEYPTMQYHYRFSNFRQQTAIAGLYLPVMIGAEFRSFYFLLGTKLGVFPYLAYSQSSVDAHIWATDEKVINPMEGLYTHEMGDFSFQGDRQNLSLNTFNATASLELGFCIGKQSVQLPRNATKEEKYKELHRRKTFRECIHFKLSLFADYGLMDMFTYKANAIPYYTDSEVKPEGGLIDIPSTSRVLPNSLFGYEPHRDAVLHNLYVGVRFAFMYQIPHRPPRRGSMANPHLVTVVRNGHTGEVLKGASVSISNVNPKTKKTQTIRKVTGGKDNNFERSCPPGSYDFAVSYPGFLPYDTLGYQHGDRFDTLYIDLFREVKLSVDVVDALSRNPLNSLLTVYDHNGGKVAELPLDSGALASIPLNSRYSYTLCASSDGYFDSCCTTLPGEQRLTIPLKTKFLRKFILKNMYFATDKTKVLPSSEKALLQLYVFLIQNPAVSIHIVGHTDDVASDEYNQRLSEGRANSVKAEMVKRGISPDRISTEGKGESQPIVPNNSDSNRQLNRRVEIEVTSGNIHLDMVRDLLDL